MSNQPSVMGDARSTARSNDASDLPTDLSVAHKQLADAHNARLGLERELEQTERELHELLGHVASADAEHGDLVKLHVALSRLYESRDRASALAGIHEVIVNIIGSEHFGLFELSDDGSSLRPIGGMGLDEAERGGAPSARTLLDKVAATGEGFLAPPTFDESGLPSAPDIVACVPFRLGDRVVGVIAIYRLLPHKASLEPLDRELLDLLSTHAAPALASAELRAAPARKSVAM